MINIFLLLIIASLGGCMTQTFVPSRPLPVGDTEWRLSMNYSLNKFELPSFGWAAYHGISDNQIFGFSTNNFMLGSFSYAYYWEEADQAQNVQVHLSDIFKMNLNPSLEVAYGYSKYYGNSSHNFRAGISYAGSLLLPFIPRESMGWREILPVFGYNFQHNEIFASVQYVPCLTDYYIKYYRDDNFGINEKVDITFKHSEIDSISRYIDSFFQEYTIYLSSGKKFIIASRPTWGHELLSSGYRRGLSRYRMIMQNRILWVGFDFPEKWVEMNFSKIFDDYNEGKDIRIYKDPDIAQKTIDSNNTFFHDFFFSIGHSKIKDE